MACGHLAAVAAGCDPCFTVDASRVTFGPGALAEVGVRARALGMTRALVVTDARLRALPWFAEVAAALAAAGVDAVVFDEVAVEPTDRSIADAVAAARAAGVDGLVSLGGGSTIDTAKLANLGAVCGADVLRFVPAPHGRGEVIDRPLLPHLACPTTSGTGSEVTGIAIFDVRALHAKTGVASARLRPTEAVIDPRVTATLPAAVVAASGLDVLCHALESYTARPHGARPAPAPATARPMSQGANPWSDLGCREALRLLGVYLVRAATDAADAEARAQVMWAATLAGIAFGNAGVHVPHAMAYAVAGGVRGFVADGYPAGAPLIPHGFAVAVNAPAVVTALAATAPARHLEAAALLGGDVGGAAPTDAGAVLAATVAALMRAIAAPADLRAVGYGVDDVPALVAATVPQRRLLDNAPLAVTAPLLTELFAAALGAP
ncbi:MAG: iron-containing alcohol dehydrogenase [Myxococcales bacterium]|nr:iron-containing alcohol dehydrogenase [Myxococcales bacterium]